MDGIVSCFLQSIQCFYITVVIQTKRYSVEGLIEMSVRCRQVCRLRIRVDVGECQESEEMSP